MNFSLLQGRLLLSYPDIVTYTKIHYQENLKDRYVVLDFDMSLEFALEFLNTKMQESEKGG